MEHILSDKSERAKRNLLIVAGISIFIGATGSFPTETPFSPIELDSPKDKSIATWSLLFVQTYLAIRFSALALIDLRHNRLNRAAANFKSEDDFVDVVKDVVKLSRFVLSIFDFLVYKFTVFINEAVEVWVPWLVAFIGFYFIFQFPYFMIPY